MPRDLTYLGIDKITTILIQIDEAINGGSQTGVGIEPRVNHVFTAKSDDELRFIRDEYAYAGYLLSRNACLQDGTPDLATRQRWKNPYKRAAITQPNFGGAIPWYGAGYPET